jgi:hypothetical protein
MWIFFLLGCLLSSSSYHLPATKSPERRGVGSATSFHLRCPRSAAEWDQLLALNYISHLPCPVLGLLHMIAATRQHLENKPASLWKFTLMIRRTFFDIIVRYYP